MKKLLGKAHPDTLSSMRSLASTYRYMGRWNKASNHEHEEERRTSKNISCLQVMDQEENAVVRQTQ